MSASFSPLFTGTHSKNPHAVGDLYAMMGRINFAGSYATGGDALDFEAMLKQVGAGFQFGYTVLIAPSQGYTFGYDPLAKKVKVFQGDNTNAAAAPGIEIPAAAYPGALTAIFTGGADCFVIGV